MSAYVTLPKNERLKLLALKKEATRRAALRSLLAFTCWTKDDYEVSWHHRAFSAVLDRFMAGEIKRLMIFMPPQHGKSELATRRLAAKMLGDFPDKRIAMVAYNHTMAAKFNRDIQRIIDSPEYAELYPNTQLHGKNVRSNATGMWLRNSDEFEVVGHAGSLISVGIGGGLTGNKVDCAIIDDPYKDAVQANSAAYRAMLEEWWDSVLESRLHNDSQVCLTFTRWRHDDIAGYLLDHSETGKAAHAWTIVRFEAIKEHEQVEGDPRAPGEALWPQRHSITRLEGMRATNPLVFEAMHQQRPTPRGGNLVKEDWLRTYRISDLPDTIPAHCYIDTATSEAELSKNDPTGILTFKVWKNNLYITNFTKGRWSMPDLIANIKRIHAMYLNGRQSRIHIENKSNGRSTQQVLKEGTNFSVVLDNVKGKKIERLENELPTIEAGRVWLPHGEGWVDDFKAHVLGFPMMKHDEEVDCLTGALRAAFHRVSSIHFANPIER